MITYRIDNRSILKIEDSVITKLNQYRQDRGKSESGGILLGKIRSDFSEYIITEISEPCKKDKSGRCFFIRNKDNAQRIINQLWKSSGGQIVYLGEWHTHPELSPSPSLVDRNLIKQCSVEIEPLPPIIFLVIVGECGSLYIGCKYVNKRNSSLVELNKIIGGE
jgi:integrative and conjugative element protein (TIGR02256 family)